MRLTSFRLTHGTNSPAGAHAAAELVRTKLEMGRASRLSFARAFLGWMRPPGILVCNRYNETIGCLQNRARPRASEPGCDRSDRLTHFANRNRVGQQQCEWTNRPGEPIDPAEWPKRESYALFEAMKSADLWVFQTMVVKIEKTGERIDLNTLPVPARAASPPHL